MATVGKTPTPLSKPLDTTYSMEVTAKDASYDIYTPVTSQKPGLKSIAAISPGSLLTTDDQREMRLPQGGGSLSVAAAFAGAIKAAGPAALLLAAHALLPKRRGTYKSPKRSSHRGGTRRSRRH